MGKIGSIYTDKPSSQLLGSVRDELFLLILLGTDSRKDLFKCRTPRNGARTKLVTWLSDVFFNHVRRKSALSRLASQRDVTFSYAVGPLSAA